MSAESGPKRTDPHNPNPPHKKVPLDLVDPAGLLPLPKPELPSDGRFTASAGHMAVDAALQLQPEVGVGLAQRADERTRYGYI